LIDSKESSKLFDKFDVHQRQFYENIHEYLVTCVDAVAGSGKTTISTMAAFEMFEAGTVNKIVYIRLPSVRSLKQGFLPGSIQEKESVLMGAFFDATDELGIRRETVDSMIAEETLVLCSDLGLRGKNLKDAFIIIDEIQEADIGDLQLILTRIHDSCRVVLAGHSDQRDNKPKTYQGLSAFQLYSLHLSKKSFAISCDLAVNYRGKLSTWADAIQETLDDLIDNKVML
jgi:phosphate starvation-inducible protein PhoH